MKPIVTPEFIAAEVWDIMNNENWGDNLYIYLKNIFEDPVRTGYVLFRAERDKNPLTISDLEGHDEIEFSSLEAMVSAGWIVD